MPDPVQAIKIRTALVGKRWDDLRRLLRHPHERLYQTSAPFHTALDVLADLLPTMAGGLDPIEQGALAALLPRMIEALAMDADAYAGRVAEEIRRVTHQGGPVRPPAGPPWGFPRG